MTKEKAEEILKVIAKEQADKYGYRHLYRREKEFWGNDRSKISKGFETVYMQYRTIGYNCSHRGGLVELDYQFDNPRLTVYGKKGAGMATLELGDSFTGKKIRYYCGLTKRMESYRETDNDFVFHSAQIEGKGALTIFKEIKNRYDELSKTAE